MYRLTIALSLVFICNSVNAQETLAAYFQARLATPEASRSAQFPATVSMLNRVPNAPSAEIRAAVPFLRASLQRKDDLAREASAAFVLASQRPDAGAVLTPAINDLLDMLSNPDEPLSNNAALVLRNMSARNPDLVNPPLLGYLSDESRPTVPRLQLSLTVFDSGKNRDAAITVIESLLTKKLDTRTSILAIETLSQRKLTSDGFGRFLLDALRSPNKHVRIAAIDATFRADRTSKTWTQGQPILTEMAQGSEKDPDVKRLADMALKGTLFSEPGRAITP